MVGEFARRLRRTPLFQVSGRGARYDRHGGDAARDRCRPQRGRDPDAEIEAIADQVRGRVVQPDLQVDGRMLLPKSADRRIEATRGEGVR